VDDHILQREYWAMLRRGVRLLFVSGSTSDNISQTVQEYLADLEEENED
jgi:hypothetical protein